nr:unnamed protein product [Callosobruchus analis]
MFSKWLAFILFNVLQIILPSLTLLTLLKADHVAVASLIKLALNFTTVGHLAQLLHYIGEEGMTIFNTSAFEADEEAQAKNCARKYFLPKGNISYECFKFFTRQQMPTESFEQFVIDLKNKARPCGFGDLKDSLIRDMLTCGLADTKIT